MLPSLTLTAEQQSALDAFPASGPVQVFAAGGDQAYVLLPAAEYQKLLGVDDRELLHSLYPSMNAVARAEGWDDREMDAYNALDPRRTS